MAVNKEYTGSYRPIPPNDTNLEESAVNPNHKQKSASWHWPFLGLHFLLLSIWIVTISWRLPVSRAISDTDSTAPWSPLAHLVKYENQIFHTGFKSDLTEYQGAPNDENERAWEELTKVGIVLLDADQAAKLPNKTVQWPKVPGKYLAAVSVFHQLHCVDYLRKNMFAASRGNGTSDSTVVAHLDHCADYLRQVLTCHGDVTMTSFRWNEAADLYQPVFNGLQQCRSFEPIYRWAEEHAAPGLRP